MAEKKDRRIKVAILTTFPPPYRVPLFNEISREPEIDLEVLIAETKGFPDHDWDSKKKDWHFSYRILPAITIPVKSKGFGRINFPINGTLPLELFRYDYDVLVTVTWVRVFSVIALIVGKIRNIPVFLIEESIAHQQGKIKRFFSPFLKLMFRSYSGLLLTTPKSKQYFELQGARRERTQVMPFVVDFKMFKEKSRQLNTKRKEIRKKLGIDSDHVVCFAGQIIERKGVLDLIEAVEKIRSHIPDIVLLIAGKGPLEIAIKKKVRGMGLQNNLKFMGYLEHGNLPVLFAAADVFVLPSHYDTFGAVVLEAMASGLPVVVTDGVGAADSVVLNGLNGFVVPTASSDLLADALKKILINRKIRSQMIESNRIVLENWNLKSAVNIFLETIKLEVNRRRSALSACGISKVISK